MLRIYVNICIVISALLSYEYLILNRITKAPSIFLYLRKNIAYFKDLNLSPEAGKPISYWLGWIGFGLMIFMLLYSVRKRIPGLKFLGSTSAWLDFHIFCGLLGPILIIFHTNFKVGGLVAIAFWSMIISVVSGIIGKYVHFQLGATRLELQTKLSFYDRAFNDLHNSHQIPKQDINLMKYAVVSRACSISLRNIQSLNIFEILWGSIKGDLRLYLSPPKAPRGLPAAFSLRLIEYGKLQRKIYFLESYQRIMGYWHTFHFPFSIFMYVIATIHTITVLLFRV